MAKKRTGRDSNSVSNPSTPGCSFRQYPYSIVWSPIPLLTWLLPFLGHLGICSSDGIILDFAGPFTVLRDAFLFGKPARFLQLEPRSAFAVLKSIEKDEEAASENTFSWAQVTLSSIGQGWDTMLDATSEQYQTLMYFILTNNCHCFVSQFLNVLNYNGHSNWSPLHLAAWTFLRARYVGWTGLLQTWLPFLLLVPSGVYLGRLQFVYCYCGLCTALVGWFLLYYACIWQPPPIPSSKAKR